MLSQGEILCRIKFTSRAEREPTQYDCAGEVAVEGSNYPPEVLRAPGSTSTGLLLRWQPEACDSCTPGLSYTRLTWNDGGSIAGSSRRNLRSRILLHGTGCGGCQLPLTSPLHRHSIPSGHTWHAMPHGQFPKSFIEFNKILSPENSFRKDFFFFWKNGLV